MTPKKSVEDSREDPIQSEIINVIGTPSPLQKSPHVRPDNVDDFTSLDGVQLHQPVGCYPRLVELPVFMYLNKKGQRHLFEPLAMMACHGLLVKSTRIWCF